MHFDISEELLACILQAGAKEIDHIVDNEKAVVIALTVIDCDLRILLIMAQDVKLQLSQILRLLACVDRS